MMKISKRTVYLKNTPDWPGGYAAWLPERVSTVRRVGYTLVDLVRRGLLEANDVMQFREETLLADFKWDLLWADHDSKPDAQSVADALQSAEGIVVFVHGWAGSGKIWEDLPAMVIQRNPKLVALVPDVNGFGGSPFSVKVPPINKCDPPANMKAIEAWLDLLKIRPTENAQQKRPVIFVGHSMGGASLFFANKADWQTDEIGCVALAPALLMNDRQRQRFYKTIGTGIHLSRFSDLIDRLVEKVLAPRLIESWAGRNSSIQVRNQHKRIFDMTSEGTIAQTFAAMGHLNADLRKEQWPAFVTYLAEQDVLVGVKQTHELLASIHMTPAQIRIVEGEHYFFSVGDSEVNVNNRACVIEDILQLHNRLFSQLSPKKKARSGKQNGH
jgi:pimeloyl-ACP methyl ester carboxylesterase